MKYLTGRVNAAFTSLRIAYLRSSRKFDKTIGEVLEKKGIISGQQLQKALDVQKDKLERLGKVMRLGQVIVELGYATETQLVAAINEDYQVSVTSLTDNIAKLIGERRGTFVERLPTPRIPIWLQLSLASLLIIIPTIVSLSYASLSRQKEQLYQQTLKIGMVSLNYFDNNARVPLLEDNILRLNTLIKDASNVEGILYSFIIDNNRMIKAHTDYNRIDMKFPGFDNIEKVTKKGDVTYFNYKNDLGQKVLNLKNAITFNNKKLGEVHVGISIDFINRVINQERRVILLMTMCIIILGMVIAVSLGFRFSLPISKLVLATQEIGKGNYRYKLDLNRNDELGNLASAFNQMGEDLWKKSLAQESFGKYVGAEVLEMIIANPEKTWLKGHKNEATIIFTDIRGFTTYSETKEPESVVELLNEYFEIATQAILDHGGYIDKFIGDAVLGVFGVPVYHMDHVKRAVQASIDMQNRFKKAINNGNRLLGSVGIGICTGVVVSGNIGSQVKMEYTVIGDCVNMASRLSGLAGPGEIIISENIYNQLNSIIDAKALPLTDIKGISEPVKTFKVVKAKEKHTC